MRVAVGQMSPGWMDREATTDRVTGMVTEAGEQGAQLVVFGESLIPGYPTWLDRVDGARFENAELKAMHAAYAAQCVDVENDLDAVRAAARSHGSTGVLGVTERGVDRGGDTLYCSRVMIDGDGQTLSVHRKLMPTYEERLVWCVGDGHGLRSHDVGEGRVTALNCWENWMPLARATCYAAGTDVHCAIWPGALRLTRDSTRFVAMEGRCFVISACGLLRGSDIPEGTPLREQILARDSGSDDWICNGGSAIAGPDGSWVIKPIVGESGVFVANLDLTAGKAARQNFDATGHYSRPEVLQLQVDRRRHGVTFID